MSYRTRQMEPSEPKKIPITISAPNPLLTVPHILKQQNFDSTGQTVVNPGHVTLRVLPHAEAPVSTAPVSCGELFPTQNQLRTHVYNEQESDWSKHAIVASVAGLQSKLTELDSEMRKGATPDAAGASVLRQVQDHALLLRENAKLVSATQAKHKEATGLMHQICTQINDNVEQHSTTLETCQKDLAQLKLKHTSSVGIMHKICSELSKGLLEHGEDRDSLQRDVSLLRQKDAVAQELLAKMMTMLDQHESVVSQGTHLNDEQLALLDGMCEAFEKTKTRVLTLEQAHKDMHKVLADYKAHKLGAGAHDAEALEAKLERYARVNKDIDGRCKEALQQHGAKLDEIERSNQQTLHEQRMKIQQLERSNRDLQDKVQQLALKQLDAHQGSDINRVIERDVKQLQYQMNGLHSLKKDVETIQEATNNNNSSVSALKADVRQMQLDNKSRNQHSLALHQDVEHLKSTVSGIVDTHAEVHTKLLDMRRDLSIERTRGDKAATAMHNIECRLAA